MTGSPVAQASDVAARCRGLETQIQDVSCMCGLLADVLDQHFACDPTPLTGHPNKYHLTTDAANRMLFAACHLQKMTGDLEEDYFSAIEYVDGVDKGPA